MNTHTSARAIKPHNSLRWLLAALVLVSGYVLTLDSADAAELNFVVQPILPEAQTREAFQPLADYLSKATGQKIKLITTPNFLTYWETMKKGDQYHLVLDAAHFTAFRNDRMKYTVLAKIPESVSYTLVTNESSEVLEPQELIGKTVATIASPSLGAVRLAEMYPNPLRQPIIVEVDNSIASIDKVLNAEAAAAIVPTPLVGNYPSLITVVVTEQVPHIAISAAPSVDKKTQNMIRKALVNASKTPEGQAMLKAINFAAFEPASGNTYKGFASLLEGVWGY